MEVVRIPFDRNFQRVQAFGYLTVNKRIINFNIYLYKTIHNDLYGITYILFYSGLQDHYAVMHLQFGIIRK